jgi:BASS family bile acid:Na+ symporter
MLLVAACPGGSLSNVITHFGRGNTALSVSISAVAAVMALVLTPLNFAWMMAANPATAGWMRSLSIDASDIWWSLLALLALPMALGLTVHHRGRSSPNDQEAPRHLQPAGAARLHRGRLVAQRALLDARILPSSAIVILHNAAGLLLGFLCALAFRVAERDRRAIVIEGGMQNSGLALGIIAVTFNADLGMVIIASLWGIWHIVSGLTPGDRSGG